jgi:REP element-mobilizing transposase RayT
MSDKYTIRNKQGIYFMTFTIVGWVDLFTRVSFRDVVVESLKYCQKEKGLIIYAWCLMPSHLHLIAAARDGFDLSDIIRDFKKFTNKKIITLIKNEPESRRDWLLDMFEEAGRDLKRFKYYKVWQDGSMAKELLTGNMAFQKLEYTHNNPVESGIVLEASHYIYSSAKAYERKPGLIDVELL